MLYNVKDAVAGANRKETIGSDVQVVEQVVQVLLQGIVIALLSIVIEDSVFVALERGHKIRNLFFVDPQYHLYHATVRILHGIELHDHRVVGFNQAVEYSRSVIMSWHFQHNE
jgi:hypothetical protein